jgi:hypothetical protein
MSQDPTRAHQTSQSSRLDIFEHSLFPRVAEIVGHNGEYGMLRGVETPTTFPSETYHSHLREVLNAAVE